MLQSPGGANLALCPSLLSLVGLGQVSAYSQAMERVAQQRHLTFELVAVGGQNEAPLSDLNQYVIVREFHISHVISEC